MTRILVTDAKRDAAPEWVPVLRDFARASGHELRNALNALVVNLEVVRARSGSLDPASQQFVTQAVEQSEESIRLAEGSIALLNMVIGAIGEGGVLDIQYEPPRGAKIVTNESEAARAAHNLAPLVRRASLGANAAGAAVILSIPDKSRETNEDE